MKKSQLTRTFNALQKAYPEHTAHATPLAGGVFGLVVENQDGSLTKFFMNHKSKSMQQWAEKAAVNEMRFLRLLREHPINGIDTPALLKQHRIEPSDKFFAAYSMTKIPGRTFNWWNGQRIPGRKDYFHEAGKLLARFHETVKNMPVSKIKKNADWGDVITNVPRLGKDINKALDAANDYFQDHMTAGIIHGDFHGGNIMADEQSRPSGLIDFAAAGKHANMAIDFHSIPKNDLKPFVAGYEAESGESIDPTMITLSELSTWTATANHSRKGTELGTLADQKINEKLKKLAPITGFKP